MPATANTAPGTLVARAEGADRGILNPAADGGTLKTRPVTILGLPNIAVWCDQGGDATAVVTVTLEVAVRPEQPGGPPGGPGGGDSDEYLTVRTAVLAPGVPGIVIGPIYLGVYKARITMSAAGVGTANVDYFLAAWS